MLFWFWCGEILVDVSEVCEDCEDCVMNVDFNDNSYKCDQQKQGVEHIDKAKF